MRIHGVLQWGMIAACHCVVGVTRSESDMYNGVGPGAACVGVSIPHSGWYPPHYVGIHPTRHTPSVVLTMCTGVRRDMGGFVGYQLCIMWMCRCDTIIVDCHSL